MQSVITPRSSMLLWGCCDYLSTNTAGEPLCHVLAMRMVFDGQDGRRHLGSTPNSPVVRHVVVAVCPSMLKHSEKLYARVRWRHAQDAHSARGILRMRPNALAQGRRYVSVNSPAMLR